MRGRINADYLFELVARGDLIIKPIFDVEINQSRIRNIIKKFSDLPCSFTDACLVRMLEITVMPIFLRLMGISTSTATATANRFRWSFPVKMMFQ